jgi:hypothetical protein
MEQMKELALFLYGKGFWYADPLREIEGLAEEQLLWVPGPGGLPILWHVGHIAHRERTHIGVFLEGLRPGEVIPTACEVFGTDWHPVKEIRGAGPVNDILEWVREVRARSHEFISRLGPDDFNAVPPNSPKGLSVAHWVFITTAHTALHIGRIQLLRSLVEGEYESAC